MPRACCSWWLWLLRAVAIALVVRRLVGEEAARRALPGRPWLAAQAVTGLLLQGLIASLW
ncbi:hypothetical protein N5079_33445 [Planotetraspora sp. A-T 1434]|uniref:hypothetical protein n=1 Tax=Planotetraspora sp. A-T 1434 TaxID=2979219 RepID=UPI0021BF2C4D|nr:hypothetical protein [Planotetraspora sp. A-T 1434]MCT9935118.1 hypothetical protein [Planotetraspora sp. A-T 1434]